MDIPFPVDEIPAIKLITAAEVTRINMTICAREGMDSGLRRDANLALVLDQPAAKMLETLQELYRQGLPTNIHLARQMEAEFGNEAVNPVVIKRLLQVWADSSAALAFNLVQLTPFKNCNCGTAAMSARAWLSLNGMYLDSSSEEELGAVVKLYNGTYTWKDMAEFFAEHLRLK